MTCQLTQDPTDRLAELEAVIDQSAHAFYQVGKALLEIREAKLWKLGGHKNFGAYLLAQPHWSFGRAHAYRLIAAARTVDLSPNGRQLANEHQARIEAPKARLEQLAAQLISRMTPEQQREAVEASEKKILAAQPAVQVGGEQRGERIGRIERKTASLRREVEGLGGDGDEALAELDRFALAVGRIAA